jgi:hypothetical protein
VECRDLLRKKMTIEAQMTLIKTDLRRMDHYRSVISASSEFLTS